MSRETFGSRFGALMTMIGVAVGLGDVWRFPYMVGRFGGAAFVLLYLVLVGLIGVPALMAEWTLGRHTRRGTVGAFAAAGMPFGRLVGWFFFGKIFDNTALLLLFASFQSAAIGMLADVVNVRRSAAPNTR